MASPFQDFLRGFRIRNRLIALIGLLILPAAIPAGIHVFRDQRDISVARRELEGLVYQQSLLNVLRLTQETRGMTLRHTSGDRLIESRLRDKLEEANQAALAFEKVNEQFAASQRVNESGKTFLAEWDRLRKAAFGFSYPEAFAQFNALNTQITTLLRIAAGDSAMILDPEPATYYYIYSGSILLPSLTENLGRLRAMGSSVIVRGRATPEDSHALAISIAESRRISEQVHESIDFALQHDDETEGRAIREEWKNQAKTVQTFLDRAEAVRLGQPDTADAYFTSATTAIRSLFALQTAAAERSRTLLERRLFTLTLNSAEMGGLTGAAVLLAFLLGVWISKSITNPLRALTAAITALNHRGADLTMQLPRSGADELSVISDQFNQFLNQLEDIIRQIKTTSLEAAQSAGFVHTSIVHLGDALKNQAASTEESSASVEEVTASITGITENLGRQAASIADTDEKMEEFSHSLDEVSRSMTEFARSSEEVATKAQLGETAARETSAAMERLAEISSRIEEIVLVITEISEQTDLLSLNASIEAARAGDAGRGFAVVSSEITKLSEKTAGNARDIRALIAEAANAVERGGDQVQRLTVYLTEMTQGVRASFQRLQEINRVISQQTQAAGVIVSNTKSVRMHAAEIQTSSGEQKRAAMEMGRAVDEISRATQHILERSLELETGADRMKKVSTALEGLVGRFRLEGS